MPVPAGHTGGVWRSGRLTNGPSEAFDSGPARALVPDGLVAPGKDVVGIAAVQAVSERRLLDHACADAPKDGQYLGSQFSSI